MNSLLPHRKPSLLKRILRVLGLGVVGGMWVTVAGLLVHFVMEGEGFHLYKIDIQGNERVSSVQIRHLMDARLDQHLATIRTQDIAQGVQRHPWVESVKVRLSYPSTVHVEVVEHQPVMLIALDALWYVDQMGRPFHQANSADLDYPILTGIDDLLVTEHPTLASAIIGRALSLLDESAAPPLYGTTSISEVRFNRRTGFTLVLRSGTEVMLGFTDPEVQLSRLHTMTQQGLVLSTPQRVDLNAERVAIATPLPSL